MITATVGITTRKGTQQMPLLTVSTVVSLWPV